MEEEEEEAILGQDIVLREKAVLKKLLAGLPVKAQLGFSGLKEKFYNRNDSTLKDVLKNAKQNDGLKVEYTCIDISNETIVLGCNLGIVFFYCRKGNTLNKFVCENKHAAVVSVQVLERRQFVGSGQYTGTITIFQYGEDKNRLVKALLKCTVDAHHRAPVTSIQWTPDGTKLFTADSEGNVAITVLNMDEGKTHTVFICHEDSAITQLSFSHTALLISTLRRSLVWPFTTKKIVQVGMQERKSIGNFGACFFPAAGPLPTDLSTDLFAARPGLRLWKANVEGKVLSTMIFKESIQKGEPIIETIDLPSNITMPAQGEVKQFGPLLVFNDQFLVTWKGSCLWVVDPNTGFVVGAHNNLGCVVDVSVNNNEIFVLSKGDQHFIRRIIFETRTPCIVVEELDLNNPEEISKAQRTSSISQFEDQDKIDKLIDGVGMKVKYAFSDVKSKVKEIKEQITSRENSEDDRNSDRMASPSTAQKAGCYQNTESTDFTTSENDTSTENEKSNEIIENKPFESSNEFNKNIESASRSAATEARPPPLFHHLSSEDFPKDIVFKGTSAKTTNKKKKTRKKKGVTKEWKDSDDEDTDTLCNYNGATIESHDSINTVNCDFLNQVNLDNNETLMNGVNSSLSNEKDDILNPEKCFLEKQESNLIENDSPEFYFSTPKSASPPLQCNTWESNSVNSDLYHNTNTALTSSPENSIEIRNETNDCTTIQGISPTNHEHCNGTVVTQESDCVTNDNITDSDKNTHSNATIESISSDIPKQVIVDAQVICKNTAVSDPLESRDISNDVNLLERVNSLETECHYNDVANDLNSTETSPVKNSQFHVSNHTENDVDFTSQPRDVLEHPLKTACEQDLNSTGVAVSTNNIDDALKKSSIKSVDESSIREGSVHESSIREGSVHEDSSVVHVKISHQRQGSNASIQSLGFSERCKEVRGEAVEKERENKPILGNVTLGFDDTIESNVQRFDEESLSIADITQTLNIRTDMNDSILDGKLYPVSPFPAPQMSSIYSQRHNSFTDYTSTMFDDSTDVLPDTLEPAVGDVECDYDAIDINLDLIESIDSITDVEDNVNIDHPNEIKKSGTKVRTKRKKDRFSLPSSPASSDMEGRPLNVTKDRDEKVQERLRYLADSWAEVNSPTSSPIQHISCSTTLVWAIDSQDNIYFAPAHSSQSYTWKKCDGKATLVASNQEGSVIWCVDRNKVTHYRRGVKKGHFQGTNWEPFEKDIHYIAIDLDCVWAIKTNGDVFVRTGVSSQRPYGGGWLTVKQASDLVQITCLNGIVWALDIYNHVQIFQGELDNLDPSDADILTNWVELPGITATHVMLGAKAACWIIDSDSGVWFNQDISRENPLDGKWYQLSLGEHDTPHEATRFSSILSYFTKGNEPKMTVANEVTGVLMLGKLGTIHVAHGHLLGTRWELTRPGHIKDNACWSCVTAGGSDMNRGFTWALQPNGQLFCFKANGSQKYNVHPPNRVLLKYCSAGPRSLWALTANQDVYVRLGISDTSPQGLKWLKVDMLSQNNKRLTHICNGNLVVWAVDFEGNVWFQMGREERRGTGFSPAWVSVEGCPLDGTKFTKVVVGPDDYIVWACDDKNNLYARKDITDNFWVGTSWEIVSGSSGKDIAISHNHVWALCPNGDVICRFGVSKSNVIGDYWKKVPGNFEQISVSAHDELWGIDRQGHLYERQTLLFYGSTLSNRAPSYNDLFSDHNDWEFI